MKPSRRAPEIRTAARRAVGRARTALGDPRARPNLTWLFALTGARPSDVSRVLEETEALVPVEEAIQRLHRAGGRSSYAQFRAPFELYAFVRLLRPDHVVETGVSSGVSSAHFLAALRKNHHGTLHSIDLPTRQRGALFRRGDSPVALPPGRETGWAVPAELKTGWDLRLGPSQELLPPLLESLGSVGVFLHDSLHTPAHLTFELTSVAPRLTPGSIVLADNTVWTGSAFPRFASSIGARVVRRGRTDLVGLRTPAERPVHGGQRRL
jgi:hypothetical protein